MARGAAEDDARLRQGGQQPAGERERRRLLMDHAGEADDGGPRRGNLRGQSGEELPSARAHGQELLPQCGRQRRLAEVGHTMLACAAGEHCLEVLLGCAGLRPGVRVAVVAQVVAEEPVPEQVLGAPVGDQVVALRADESREAQRGVQRPHRDRKWLQRGRQQP